MRETAAKAERSACLSGVGGEAVVVWRWITERGGMEREGGKLVEKAVK